MISKALKLIDANAHVADQEAQTVRNRQTTVKAEIGRLVAVPKEMGTGGLDSIKEELARLEREKRELQARLEELQEQKTPVDQVMALAKKFIENWPGVGELLQQATGDERRGILEQYVEVVQMTPTGPEGKSGTYVLRLFPEATPDREVHNGAEPAADDRANDDPVFTESSLVREVGEKAPRLGLEAGTESPENSTNPTEKRWYRRRTGFASRNRRAQIPAGICSIRGDMSVRR